MVQATWVEHHGLKHPYGYCQCGCGQKTALARQGDTTLGYTKGEPVMYIRNHHKTESSLASAFWKHVQPSDNDTCWEWQGSRKVSGYGWIKRHGKVSMAHKVSYELHHGRIPDGLVVCHHCDNRGCVNPKHLFLGTYADNSTDMVAKGRQAKGESVGNSALTKQDVIQIRKMAGEGMPQAHIAPLFGVHYTTIGCIVRRETWKHVED